MWCGPVDIRFPGTQINVGYHLAGDLGPNRKPEAAIRRTVLWNSRQRGAPCGTPHALYSKPFAFRTVWAAGEERNVTSALPASV